MFDTRFYLKPSDGGFFGWLQIARNLKEYIDQFSLRQRDFLGRHTIGFNVGSPWKPLGIEVERVATSKRDFDLVMCVVYTSKKVRLITFQILNAR